MSANKHADEFDKLIKGYGQLKLRIIRQVAAQAVTFFKSSFVNQGFTDQSLVKWKSRLTGTPNNTGRAILMGSGAGAGTLKRAIRIKQANADGAVVGLDPALEGDRSYGEIMNFGGEIPVTPQMRRYFWAMYYKNGGGAVSGKSQKAQTANANAQFYMNLALTKEKHLTIPARQFIGDSAMLERQLTQYITSELDKFFKVTS